MREFVHATKSVDFRVAQADEIGKAPRQGAAPALSRLATLLHHHAGRVHVKKNDKPYGEPLTRREGVSAARKFARTARPNARLTLRTNDGMRYVLVADAEVPTGPIDVRDRHALQDRLSAEIAELSDVSEFRAPLTAPTCDHGDPPGLVTLSFIYRSGREVVVTCHAQVMVALLTAMKKAPGIEVTASSTSMYSGSYRTFDQQNTLYQAWINHAPGSHLATNPCYGYHRRGRALDILNASSKEKRALLSVRVAGQQFYNGESFGDPPHYSFGAKG